MKKRIRTANTAVTGLVLLIAVLIIGQTATAQIVINRSSFDAFLNGQYTVTVSSSVDTVKIMSLLEQTGPDQTWDFTGLEYEFTATGNAVIETFSSIGGTPGEGDEHFELATEVIFSTISFDDFGFVNYEYIVLNNDMFLFLGSISVDPEDPEEFDAVVYNRPGEILYQFPTTYESEWQYEYEEEIESFGFVNTTDLTVTVNVDGWGKLVSPQGIFDVLRITSITKQEFFGFFIEMHEIEFVTADGFPIASISAETDPFSGGYDALSMEASLNVFTTGTSNPREIISELPDRATLHQNYPNPFNPSTIITYELPEAATVSLDIYTVTGIRVMPVISERSQSAGRHSVSVDASTLASGVYIYQLRTGSQVLTRKMTLIK